MTRVLDNGAMPPVSRSEALAEPLVPGLSWSAETILASPSPETRREHTPRRFRPDVEGLRALAVLAVVAFHASLGVRGGYVGVDVFFVISGFLITTQLTAEVGRAGIRALPSFYVRRIRRLLPASTVVVLATLAATRIWAPPLSRLPIAIDSLFTAGYSLNYRLAAQGTQYLHEGTAASPLQHYWSLGVEEQFYVLWPLLIVVAAVLGRRRLRATLATVLVLVVATSFAASVILTHQLASWAYFSLHTRGWELAIGALVAVATPKLAAVPRRLAEFVALAGLGGIVFSAFAYTTHTAYPGSAAALPVLSTAAVIAAGCGGRRGVERVLGEPMLQSLGRVSYSWYLWHWPMIVFAPMVVGHPLGWVGRVCVVWLSLATAIATYFAVEDRFRRKRGTIWRGFAAGFGMAAMTVAAATVVMVTLPSLVGSGAAVTVTTADAATPAVFAQLDHALVAGVATIAAPRNLTPSPAKAATDLPAADGTNCHANFQTVNQGACVWGDPAGTHTAVIFGDSHADMWLPAFDRAGKSAHWKVIDWTKSACPPAQLTVYSSVLNRTYTECDAWRRDTVDRIVALRPDIVFVAGSENVVGASTSPSAYAAAMLATMHALAAGAHHVELLADVPVPDYDMPGCIAAHLDDVRPCRFALARAYAFPSRHQAMTAQVQAAGFTVVDPAPWICAAQTCPAIVGNLITYRDQTHLTASFASWLAPRAQAVLTP